MKTRNLLIGVVTFVMILTSSYAFAQQGTPPQNRDNREYNRPYRFQNMDLTDAQRDQLETEHKTFFNATQPFHQDLRAKELELAAELAKKNPDAKRAAALQKEISDLDAALGQKQLEHALAIHKICPDVGRNCCGYGFGGRGYGYDGGYGPHCKDGRWRGHGGWRHHR